MNSDNMSVFCPAGFAMLTTSQDASTVHEYLSKALAIHSKAELARQLGVNSKTLRRWELREVEPRPYLKRALQSLLPLELPFDPITADFTFIDLFAGIGGLRLAFEESGGQCVFTSEWDSYAQKTYAANFPGGHQLNGDITKIAAEDVPNHDVLLAGFPCQPFSIAGVSKNNALDPLLPIERKAEA